MKKSYLIFLIISLLLLPNYAFSDDIMLIDEDDTKEEQLIQEPTLKAFSPLTFSGNEAIFKQNSTKITTIDPSSTVNLFPGGRGANQLIVYTPKYGVHTGTNEFGTEAIVEDNVVTSISGADSVIPQNGIVIGLCKRGNKNFNCLYNFRKLYLRSKSENCGSAIYDELLQNSFCGI